MATDQTIRICWPFKYSEVCSKRNTIIASILNCVFISLNVGLVQTLSLLCPVGAMTTRSIVHLLIMFDILPLAFIICAYSAIFKVDLHHRRRIREQEKCTARGKPTSKHDVRIVITTFLMAIVWVVLTLPHVMVLAEFLVRNRSSEYALVHSFALGMNVNRVAIGY